MSSVNQTGSIKQRSKGSWEIRYNTADAQGERKRINETVRGTKSDAKQVLKVRLAELENGFYVDKNNGTVAQLMEQFIAVHCVESEGVRLRTKHGYQGQINRYISRPVLDGVQAIGRAKFQELQPAQVKKLYADMSKRGLSNTTILHLHRLLRTAFNWAAGADLISAGNNPIARVKAPKKGESELVIWEEETILDFLSLCQYSIYGDVFSLAIRTGLRRSEICGLKWDAVDLVKGRLRVQRTLQLINGHGLVEGEPKTTKSRRTIILGQGVIDILHTVRGRQMQRGFPTIGESYVFTRPSGLPLLPTKLTAEFTRFVREHNLPNMNFHGLRHCFATLSLLAGIDGKVVSESLGHSNHAITVDLYQHAMTTMREAHAIAVDNILKREPQAT